MTDQDMLLDRVRKLLAKAEAEGVTPAEAEALTAKAAELMARYGIDRARLAAARPDTDQPGSRIIAAENPWAQVKIHLLAGIASAIRCTCVLLPGGRIHVFGYASDLERADILDTSLLVQMGYGLAAAQPPATARSARAWRRSCSLSSRCVEVLATIFAIEERPLRRSVAVGEVQRARSRDMRGSADAVSACHACTRTSDLGVIGDSRDSLTCRIECVSWMHIYSPKGTPPARLADQLSEVGSGTQHCPGRFEQFAVVVAADTSNFVYRVCQM
jgi:hypothetical protein